MATVECWAGHSTGQRRYRDCPQTPTLKLHFSESLSVPRAPQSPYTLLSSKPVKILGAKGLKESAPGTAGGREMGRGQMQPGWWRCGVEHQRGTKKVKAELGGSESPVT